MALLTATGISDLLAEFEAAVVEDVAAMTSRLLVRAAIETATGKTLRFMNSPLVVKRSQLGEPVEEGDDIANPAGREGGVHRGVHREFAVLSLKLFIGLLSVSALVAAGCRARAAAPVFESRWLQVEGQSGTLWCPDPQAWVRHREQVVQRLVAGRPGAHLPLHIRLDTNLVEAAKRRGAIHPVSRCADSLCGVASNEFDDEWDRLTAAALFTPEGADPIGCEAFGAAIVGTFHGESVDTLAAAMVRANLIGTALHSELDDELLEIPAMASLIRFLDPTHQGTWEPLSRQLGHLAPAQVDRWKEELMRIPSSHPNVPLHLPLLGATFSVINDVKESPISDRSHLEVEHLRDLGYNALALIPFAGQRGPYADDVRMWNRSPESETDLDLQVISRKAHSLGMTRLLKPQVWVGQETDSLHINPRGGWDRWFASYRRFLLHHALLARLEGIEWLAVGTELTLTERQPQWHALIHDIRAIYPGHIVYAANWDAFAATPFWNELDAIGIDVYAPLSKNEHATDAELLAGARANVDEVTRLAERVRKPVILTEAGFPSTRAPWREPWSERREEPLAHLDQARCYRAFLTALSEAPWFSGVFIWKYESDPDFRDAEGFLPDYKPAAKVIESFLADAARRRSSDPASPPDMKSKRNP